MEVKNGFLAGLFDGHGTAVYADHCKEMLDTMKHRLEENHPRHVENIPDMTYEIDDHELRTLLDVVAEYGKEALKKAEYGGSTFVVVFIRETNMIVINCGDSRAVYTQCEYLEGEEKCYGSLITTDHNFKDVRKHNENAHIR